MNMISIIIPVYNSGQYIKYCLDSIINQTYKNFEVICIDNSSTDNSSYIIEEYCKRDVRFKYLMLNKNRGSGVARNIGIAHAKGDYIIFCDPDDSYPKNALKNLFYGIKNTTADFCVGNIQILDYTFTYIKSLPAIVSAINIITKETVLTNLHYSLFAPVYHVRFLFRSSFIRNNKIYYPKMLRGQDLPMLAKAISTVKQAVIIPDTVYCYRSPKLYRLNTDKKFDDFLLSIKLATNIFKKYKLYKHADLLIHHTIYNFSNINSYNIYTKHQRLKIVRYLEIILNNANNFDLPPYGSYINARKNLLILKYNLFIYICIKLYRKIYSTFKFLILSKSVLC